MLVLTNENYTTLINTTLCKIYILNLISSLTIKLTLSQIVKTNSSAVSY